MFESRVVKVESRISREAQGARKGERCFSFPQPPASSPHPRRSGISLTEVLIAMGILTIGLLGVASVFPVGGWYMQRAEIADRGSAIAQSVMSDIIARGLMNPAAWFVAVPEPLSNVSTSPNLQVQGIDGKYSGAVVPGTFTRPFAEAMIAGLKMNVDNLTIAKQFGSAFAIDPMFAASAAWSRTNPNRADTAAYAFPATAYALGPWTGGSLPYYTNSAWDPWRSSSTANSRDKVWPIRRVSFELSTGLPYDKAMAESVARIGDDLVSELPSRDDRPASQKWDVDSASGAPLTRQWTGDYSWMATVTPTTNAARNGMAHNPEGFEYDVSVVVFYKRPLPTALPVSVPDMADASSNERTVGAKIISTGQSGGQLLLTAIVNAAGVGDVTDSTGKTISPFDQLKVGQWIMLCGPHPNSSTAEPKFVLNWYQVLSVEGTEKKLNYYGTDNNPTPSATDPDRRLVTVRGAQWPWQPTVYPAPSGLSDDLCVGIVKGAVAVHSKTIRLESLSGSSFGSGMTTFTPAGIPSPSIAY